FYWFALLHVRTGRLSFTPVPGLLALLFFNRALRAENRRAQVGWALAVLPLLMHQFLSFTRGYWLALLVCFPYSVFTYTGRGKGVSRRWRNAAAVMLLVAGLAVAGAALLAAAFGISNLATEAGQRLASSGSTEFTYEAGSNIVRLVEYAQVLTHIVQSP